MGWTPWHFKGNEYQQILKPWLVDSGLMLGAKRHSSPTHLPDISRKSRWHEQLLAPQLLDPADPFPLVLAQLCTPSSDRAHWGTNPAPNTWHKGRAPQQQGGEHCWAPSGVLAAHGASLALVLQPLPDGGLKGVSQWPAHSAGLTHHSGVPNVLAWHGSVFSQEQGCYNEEVDFIHNTGCVDFSQEWLYFERKIYVCQFLILPCDLMYLFFLSFLGTTLVISYL